MILVYMVFDWDIKSICSAIAMIESTYFFPCVGVDDFLSWHFDSEIWKVK